MKDRRHRLFLFLGLCLFAFGFGFFFFDLCFLVVERQALDFDASAVRQDESLGDRHAEAGAAGFAGAGTVAAIEAVEDMLTFFFAHADAGVGDGENEILLICPGVEDDDAAICGVAQGIAHEIQDDLLEPLWIGVAIRQLVGVFDFHGDVAGL